MTIEDIGGGKVLQSLPYQYLQWRKWPEKEIPSLPTALSRRTKFQKSPGIQRQVIEALPDIRGIKEVLVIMEVIINEGLRTATQGPHYQEGILGTQIQVEGSTKNVEDI